MRSRWVLFIVHIFFSLPLLGQVTIITSHSAPSPPSRPTTGAFMAVFRGEPLVPRYRNPNVSYGLDPKQERFFVYVPESYTGATPFGLVVFTAPSDNVTAVSEEWMSVLEARKLLFVAAENSGNEVQSSKRMGLAVLGALEMMKHYRIDPNRIYASGFSGGARIAGKLGFFQSDLFRGTIQNSGADFYKTVARAYATSTLDSFGNTYGVFRATATEVEAAKLVRFVLITGSNDFRRGNILDIYHGGFAKAGIHSKLLDVPGLGHDLCDGKTFSAALDFIEGK